MAQDLRSNDDRCPKCDADLQGDPIPEKSQHLYGATHFSRKMALYDQGRDRTIAFKCPDCLHEWGRE